MGKEGYDRLLDALEPGQPIDPERFFELMRDSYGVANLIYLAASRLPDRWRVHRIHHTFPREAERHYIKRSYHRIDPILKHTLGGLRPIDWAWARSRHPESEPLFRDAAAFGIPLHGIAFPLPGYRGLAAMLAVNADVTDRHWATYRRTHLRDFHLIAGLFHAALLDKDVDGSASPRLTARESEVLTWAAAGKSYWEIATILGISERTVRFFMANVRQKLNATSNSHAVAQATWQGLLPCPYSNH